MVLVSITFFKALLSCTSRRIAEVDLRRQRRLPLPPPGRLRRRLRGRLQGRWRGLLHCNHRIGWHGGRAGRVDRDVSCKKTYFREPRTRLDEINGDRVNVPKIGTVLMF